MLYFCMSDKCNMQIINSDTHYAVNPSGIYNMHSLTLIVTLTKQNITNEKYF